MAVPERTRPVPVHLGVEGLTIERAIDHLVDAAQGVVENQVELARLELELTAGRVLRGAVLVLVGAVLLGGACVALGMAGYAVFPPEYPPVERLLVIAGAAAVVGLVLALAGGRSVRAHGRN